MDILTWTWVTVVAAAALFVIAWVILTVWLWIKTRHLWRSK